MCHIAQRKGIGGKEHLVEYLPGFRIVIAKGGISVHKIALVNHEQALEGRYKQIAGSSTARRPSCIRPEDLKARIRIQQNLRFMAPKFLL